MNVPTRGVGASSKVRGGAIHLANRRADGAHEYREESQSRRYSIKTPHDSQFRCNRLSRGDEKKR